MWILFYQWNRVQQIKMSDYVGRRPWKSESAWECVKNDLAKQIDDAKVPPLIPGNIYNLHEKKANVGFFCLYFESSKYGRKLVLLLQEMPRVRIPAHNIKWITFSIYL